MKTFKLILFSFGFVYSVYQLFKLYRINRNDYKKVELRYYLLLSILFFCLLIDKIYKL